MPARMGGREEEKKIMGGGEEEWEESRNIIAAAANMPKVWAQTQTPTCAKTQGLKHGLE